MHNASHAESGMYLQQKYGRFKLFQPLFMHEVSLKDRLVALNEYFEKESLVARNTLNQLIAMSRNQIQCPEHFRLAQLL